MIWWQEWEIRLKFFPFLHHLRSRPPRHPSIYCGFIYLLIWLFSRQSSLRVASASDLCNAYLPIHQFMASSSNQMTVPTHRLLIPPPRTKPWHLNYYLFIPFCRHTCLEFSNPSIKNILPILGPFIHFWSVNPSNLHTSIHFRSTHPFINVPRTNTFESHPS